MKDILIMFAPTLVVVCALAMFLVLRAVGEMTKPHKQTLEVVFFILWLAVADVYLHTPMPEYDYGLLAKVAFVTNVGGLFAALLYLHLARVSVVGYWVSGGDDVWFARDKDERIVGKMSLCRNAQSNEYYEGVVNLEGKYRRYSDVGIKKVKRWVNRWANEPL